MSNFVILRFQSLLPFMLVVFAGAHGALLRDVSSQSQLKYQIPNLNNNETCPKHTSGRPPNCQRIKCPTGWSGSFQPYCTEKPACPTDRPDGVWPYCKPAQLCPANSVGQYPFCECAPGTIGQSPDCEIAQPSQDLQSPHQGYFPPELPAQVPSLIGYLPPEPINIVGYLPPTTLHPDLLGYLPPASPSPVYLPANE